MKKVKVALIGYGHLGKWHAQKAEALEQSELVAIVDPVEQSRSLAREAFPNVRVVSSLNEIINDIDAGLVVTPTSYHAAVCEELIKNDKHIFCEKPVTFTLEEALGLKHSLGDKKLVIQVGHSERCHEFWEKISDYSSLVENAKVINIVRNSPFKGRAADVGVVEDLMIHDIDLMRMFYGNPKSVTAYGSKVMTSKWDHVKASFFYDSKVFHIENSRNDVKVERSVQFNGPDGILRVDLLNLKVLVSKDITSDRDQEISEFSYERRDHLLIEQGYFYDSILKQKKIFVSLDDGIEAVSIIDKVNKSLEDNKAIEI